jgi:hypothetical protein
MDWRFVEAHELLPVGVEVHLAAPVEEHVHRPLAEAAASLPQLQCGRLVAVDQLDELVRQPLDSKWVSIEDNDELELALPLGIRRGRR